MKITRHGIADPNGRSPYFQQSSDLISFRQKTNTPDSLTHRGFLVVLEGALNEGGFRVYGVLRTLRQPLINSL